MHVAPCCRPQVLTEKRKLGSRDGPPHLVAVVALHAEADASVVMKLLQGEDVGGLVHQKGGVETAGDSFGLVLPRFKQRFMFIRPDTGNMAHTL